MRLLKEQAPGLSKGLMFPSRVGRYRTPNSLDVAWARCLTEAQIDKRFTIHGLRYTFTDLVRRANVDAVVQRALTGHVTEEMQRHYSTVGLDEKRPRSPACCGWFHPARARTPPPPPKVGFQVGFRSWRRRRPVEHLAQLAGSTMNFWSGIPDSNRRPSAWEADTLPLS